MSYADVVERMFPTKARFEKIREKCGSGMYCKRKMRSGKEYKTRSDKKVNAKRNRPGCCKES